MNKVDEKVATTASRKTIFFDGTFIFGYAILVTPVVIIILFMKFVLKKKITRDLESSIEMVVVVLFIVFITGFAILKG